LYVFFLNQGYFDQVYEAAIIRPYLRFASWLWQSVDVRLIDRPANGLAAASFRMATGLSKVVDFKKVGEPRVGYVLLVFLVLLMLLSFLAEEIEIFVLW
ncbi:MAG: hypothetical protein AAB177_14360, partial [Nitrospirota bacterium]